MVQRMSGSRPPTPKGSRLARLSWKWLRHHTDAVDGLTWLANKAGTGDRDALASFVAQSQADKLQVHEAA